MRRQHQPLRLAADDLARALSPRFLDGLQQTFELVLTDRGSDRSVVVISSNGSNILPCHSNFLSIGDA